MPPNGANEARIAQTPWLKKPGSVILAARDEDLQDLGTLHAAVAADNGRRYTRAGPHGNGVLGSSS
ncbi:hypothetical protein [uncultured Actinomyces sp.]|uniref:hypothetical protein n=1 Tax=uncultured Actinomyces sp. TaxID=249061 RepID=UPI0028D31B55|nr:hypothetical protein [uncultured Actinomyces sp.]